MVTIERVFQISGADQKYQNIRITIEAETDLECIKQIYKAYFLERLFFHTLSNDPESSDIVLEAFSRLDAVSNSVNEYIQPSLDE